MRIDPSKKIHNVSNENIVIMQDRDVAEMTRVVAFNESALELHDRLKGREFEIDDVVQALVDVYDVDREVAAADATEWVKQMREQGLIVD